MKCKTCGCSEEDHRMKPRQPCEKFIPEDNLKVIKTGRETYSFAEKEKKGIWCGICKEKWEDCKGHIEEKKGCGNIFKHGKQGQQVGCVKGNLCPSCSNQSPPGSKEDKKSSGELASELASGDKTLSDFVYQLGGNPPEIQAKYVKDFITQAMEEEVWEYCFHCSSFECNKKSHYKIKLILRSRFIKLAGKRLIKLEGRKRK